MNRIYYACYYMVSALLLQADLRFQKHSGVRAAFHFHYIKPGVIGRDNGMLYDELFEARQRGDYLELVSFEEDQMEDWIRRTKGFLESVGMLIKRD